MPSGPCFSSNITKSKCSWNHGSIHISMGNTGLPRGIHLGRPVVPLGTTKPEVRMGSPPAREEPSRRAGDGLVLRVTPRTRRRYLWKGRSAVPVVAVGHVGAHARVEEAAEGEDRADENREPDQEEADPVAGRPGADIVEDVGDGEDAAAGRDEECGHGDVLRWGW